MPPKTNNKAKDKATGAVPKAVKQSKCSFCSEPGHNITKCPKEGAEEARLGHKRLADAKSKARNDLLALTPPFKVSSSTSF